jgi:amidase
VCPSAICGVVGIKPTVGLVSRAGIIPISATQDTAGAGHVGFLDVYKVTADQVATGPLPLSAMTPCASIVVPNNGGRTVVGNLTAGPNAGDPSAASIYVGFASFGGEADAVIPAALAVTGTALVTSPGGSSACAAAGVIDLRPLDQLSY